MIYIAIPTVTPRLENCARWAIARTTPEPHRVIVARGRSHGENLDAAFSGLPADAEWFFTMDDDATPLRVGWLSWLLAKAKGQPWASFWENARGVPHPLGTLYAVGWLRSFGVWASFRPGNGHDVGEGMFVSGLPASRWGPGFFARPCDRSILPWWLRTCDVAADDHGLPIFAHLGGGTIGASRRWYQGRPPTWLWPSLVKRWITRFASNGQSYCSRCGRVVYSYSASLPVCVQCETPEEERTWRERMSRARELQAREEAR